MAINAVIAAIAMPTGPVKAINAVRIKAKLFIMRLTTGASAANIPINTPKTVVIAVIVANKTGFSDAHVANTVIISATLVRIGCKAVIILANAS